MQFFKGLCLGVVLLCALAGAAESVSTGAVVIGPRAGVKQDGTGSRILDEIRRIEFNEINYDRLSKDYFSYVEGKIPVLISAPHGAKHFRTRENRWKGEDAYTASLAIQLGRLTGAHVIFVRNKAGEDPNHDFRSRYKDAVAEAVKKHKIKFLLDLHGAAADRPFKVDVGILTNCLEKNSCPTFREIIKTSLAGFQDDPFNRRFTANGAGTMTWYARNKLGIEAAQVEINAGHRVVESKNGTFRARGEDVLELLGRLEKMIRAVDGKIRMASKKS